MEIPKDILFVALTRPAINRFGLPQKGAILLIMGTQLFAMWFGHGKPWYYLIGVPFYIALRGLTEWDHNFFRLVQLWWKTKRLAPRRGLWGGCKLSAMPAGMPENIKDIAGAV